MDLNLLEGAVKEEKFPRTRKPLHWWGREVVGGGKLHSHREECRNRGEESKAERFTQKISAKQYSPA